MENKKLTREEKNKLKKSYKEDLKNTLKFIEKHSKKLSPEEIKKNKIQSPKESFTTMKIPPEVASKPYRNILRTGKVSTSDIEKELKRLEPEGDLKEFIDSKIDFIEGKIFEEKPKPLDNLPTLFDMSKIKRQQKFIPSLNQNIMIERNLIEVPIACYSRKTKKNWVVFENKDKSITTRIGTPDGALTGFDERILWGEIFYKFKIYIKNDKPYLVSTITTYDVMKDLNLKKSGATRKRINESVEKIGALIIRYKNFQLKTEKEKISVELKDQYPVFKYQGTTHINDEKHEKSYHVFILNDIFSYNLINQYLKYIPRKRYKEIADDLTRRIWIYLSCKIGENKFYQEGLDTFLIRIGITDPRKDNAIKRLKANLFWLIEKGDINNYTIKNNILKVYKISKNKKLIEQIIEWLYKPIFKNLVKTPEGKMKNILNNFIKDYGSKRLEDLFLSYSNAAYPDPIRFLKAMKDTREKEEPMTARVTTKDIQKYKKRVKNWSKK